MKSKEALREAAFEKDMCCVAILERSDFRKAKRKKKEESETLPQVSEDIDRDIAADLRDLFGLSKNKPEKMEDYCCQFKRLVWTFKEQTRKNGGLLLPI